MMPEPVVANANAYSALAAALEHERACYTELIRFPQGSPGYVLAKERYDAAIALLDKLRQMIGVADIKEADRPLD